jgi:triosephosphate isomerase (TIM)
MSIFKKTKNKIVLKKNIKKEISPKNKKSLPKVLVKKRLIVANWKMNPVDLKEATKIFAILKRVNLKKVKDMVVICPPEIYLSDFSLKYKGGKFKFGAQDVSISNNPESTGEISAEMLKNLKAEYVIVGHSERRALGETNSVVAKKIRNAVDKGLKVILCVGEEHRDMNGEYLRFVEKQLFESLEGFNKKNIANLYVAYEPVWAIGKGSSSVDSNDLHQMNLFIKKVLVSIFDRKIGLSVPIIYGGSVDEENAKQLMAAGEVDGLLIGRASLNPYVFTKILKIL